MLSFLEFITEGRGRKRDKQKQDEYSEGIGILDQISNEKEDTRETLINQFVNEFVKPNGPCIYAFKTDKVKDAIKVGYTDQHPEQRIAQWKEIYGKGEGEVECLGYWSSEEFNAAGERVFFWDHAIHKKIRDKGYKQLEKNDFMATLTDKGKQVVDIHFSREFFDKYKRLLNGELNPDDKEELSEVLIEDIIKQMKANIKAGTADFKLYSFDESGRASGKLADKIWGSPDSYSNTELQEEAIKNGVEAVKAGKKNILMAAVMRFGKTHAAYEIVKNSGLKKVIVCSAKADVRKAWRDDINHVHFYKDFVFIEVANQYRWNITHYKGDKLVTEHLNVYDHLLDQYKDKTIIFFFTLHDLGGSVRELKEKHKKIFADEFDMMIVDETHYGSHANTFGEATGLGRKRIEESKEESNTDEEDTSIADEQQINKEAQEGLKKLNIRYKTVLQVSGTPYYILASNEMIDKDAAIISKVSYSDMLKACNKWNKEHDGEDPSKSPYFGIPTLHKIGLRLTKECRDALKDKNVTDSLTALFETKGDKFVHEKAIKSLMMSVFGDGSSKSLLFLANKKVDGNKICKHTMIVLPRVHACEVMKKLLSTFIDTNERKIFCVVGNSDVNDIDDLNNKLEELDNKGKKSIVLTCVRYLTGVSMPCLDSMIYLKNASSPQEYDQNIFRLCTRYVKKVKNPDNESRSKKVNMKENVYLIDFNIGNMLKMVNNSARMKAAAEGNPTIERIKELMEDDLKAVPIFTETKASGEILSKMKKLDNKDLMEIYTGYNKNKSIADIVNDEIDLFELLFTDKKYKGFQDLMMDLDIEGDKSKMNMNLEDDGDETVDAEGNGEAKKKTNNGLKEYTEKELNRAKLTKEKFKAITKNLLYCNICLDEPCPDLESIIDKAKKDSEFKNMLTEFKVSIGDLKKAYNMMATNFKQAYNSLICRMAQLAQDSSADSYEKFATALKGLGRLDKNEVVTPPEIVEKMINKLDESEYRKAKSILLVNEKQAEFFMGLHKKFNGKYDDKCKIVASSEIGKHLCKKMLKSVGVNNYIKNIINIDDVDGNGYYDVNDFLKMNNEEILKENNGKKFDICLMNPPYDKNMHLKFIRKCINISKSIINISPVRWLQDPFAGDKRSTLKQYEDVAKHIKDVESLKNDKSKFDIAIYSDLGIYTITNDETDFDYNNSWKMFKTETQISLINKICFGHNKYLSDVIEHNKNDGIRVLIGDIGGNRGCLPTYKDFAYAIDGKVDGVDWTKKKNFGGYVKAEGTKIPNSIKFNTKEEAQNFYNSYQYFTPLKGICKLTIQQQNIQVDRLPFFDDYSKPITEEWFKNHFNLTDDEMKELNRLGNLSYKESI